MYMYVCLYMYVCICMHVYVCMYMYVNICMYVYVCVYVCVYMYVCMYVCMCMCVYAYMCMYVCITYWGGIVRGKCPTQNGRGNCPGGNCPGELSGGIVLHPTLSDFSSLPASSILPFPLRLFLRGSYSLSDSPIPLYNSPSYPVSLLPFSSSVHPPHTPPLLLLILS